MMGFQQYLKEALAISQAREFKDIILGGKYKSYLNAAFKGQDRICLPFKGKKQKVKLPKEIQDFLAKENLDLVDYSKGLVKSKQGKDLMKLGKLMRKKGISKDVLQKFVNDPKNKNLNKYFGGK